MFTQQPVTLTAAHRPQDRSPSIPCESFDECDSGVRLMSERGPGTLRRKLCISLKCSKIWLGNFRFFERPVNDGDIEALVSTVRAKSLNAPIVPREVPQFPQ
jgi:hypothetical protein